MDEGTRRLLKITINGCTIYLAGCCVTIILLGFAFAVAVKVFKMIVG